MDINTVLYLYWPDIRLSKLDTKVTWCLCTSQPQGKHLFRHGTDHLDQLLHQYQTTSIVLVLSVAQVRMISVNVPKLNVKQKKQAQQHLLDQHTVDQTRPITTFWHDEGHRLTALFVDANDWQELLQRWSGWGIKLQDIIVDISLLPDNGYQLEHTSSTAWIGTDWQGHLLFKNTSQGFALSKGFITSALLDRLSVDIHQGHWYYPPSERVKGLLPNWTAEHDYTDDEALKFSRLLRQSGYITSDTNKGQKSPLPSLLHATRPQKIPFTSLLTIAMLVMAIFFYALGGWQFYQTSRAILQEQQYQDQWLTHYFAPTYNGAQYPTADDKLNFLINLQQHTPKVAIWPEVIKRLDFYQQTLVRDYYRSTGEAPIIKHIIWQDNVLSIDHTIKHSELSISSDYNHSAAVYHIAIDTLNQTTNKTIKTTAVIDRQAEIETTDSDRITQRITVTTRLPE